MLPSDPPKTSNRDFDPSVTNNDDDDVEMRSEDESPGVELSSVEINILIYLYLLESNFTHTAFTLLSESNLPSTSLFQHFNPSYPTPSHLNNGKSSRPNGATPMQGTSKSPVQPNFGRSEGRIERGELIRKLWKAVRWEEVERHVASNGEPYKPACPNPFHLLIPHVCPPSFPSSELNPSLPLPEALRSSTPPPAPQKRPEPFPPPPNEAGPSKTISAIGEIRNKRKTRQLSSESTSRQQSPERTDSPAKTKSSDKDGQQTQSQKKEKKKRARLSEGTENNDNMDVDQDDNTPTERKEVKITSPKKKDTLSLKVPNSTSGSRAQTPESRKPSPSVKPKDLPKESQKNGDDESGEDGRFGKWVEHRDAVSCVAWNPKNRDVLATGSGDGTARLWEFTSSSSSSPTGHLKTTKKPTVIQHKSIESSKKNITALSWHPDGTMLATGSYDGVGRLFTPSGSLHNIMTYGRGAINALKWNPSGSNIIMARDDFTVTKWGYGFDGKMALKNTFDAHTKEVNDVDWLDDDVFASAGNDHTIFVHRSNDKRPRFTFKGHSDDVTKIKWSPASASSSSNTRLLASVSDDGNCMIWKLPSYPEASTRTGGSRSLSPTKDKEGSSEKDNDDYFNGGTPVPGVDHCLHRLTVVSGSENKRMSTLEWGAVREDGRMLLAAGGQDSTVKVFDALSGECLHTLSGLETGTGSLAFSPASYGNKLGALAAGGWDGHLIVWDLESGKIMLQHEIEEDEKKRNVREQPMMLAIAWREDGKHLACGLQNKSVMVVNVDGLEVDEK
ncbi:hypothetical protein I302_106487 [Kwoniella bestiolae CBS 10118]|uniref:WD40 repeat-like protein n=1 Tax=Kwoniella bestiolae CBS 10118 TaxID=1296100 RepID=A0A1B9G192_9TREE|nr:hypothetical protein I302_06255 [Kwoniella bestiolae CBS 10118]OCF24794.1 hypothetical protein I302_06255 [Kwoniella bestiolae CBS 10118]